MNALLLAASLLVSQVDPISVPAWASGGSGGAAGPPGSLENLSATSTACNQTLPLAWDTDLDTGFVRLGADRIGLCTGAVLGAEVNANGIVLNLGDRLQLDPADAYRSIYKASAASGELLFTADPATVIQGGIGAGGTSYVQIRGHAAVEGEVLATDTISVWADSGTMIRGFNDWVINGGGTQVFEVDEQGEVRAGGGTAASPGFGFYADVDGSPTGWYRDALDSWMFERSGVNIWRLRDDFMPQTDVTQSIGAVATRLLNLHARNVVSEGLSVRASDGTTEIAFLNGSGRLGLVSSGSGASLPFLRMGANATGYFLKSGSDDVGFTRNGAEVYTIDAGGISPLGAGSWALGGVSSTDVSDKYWARVVANNVFADTIFFRSDYGNGASPSSFVRSAPDQVSWRPNHASNNLVNFTTGGILSASDNFAQNGSATTSCLNGTAACGAADRRWFETHARVTSTQRQLYNAPQTCDCGNVGTPNIVTCDITSSVVYLVDTDADDCTVTISETTAVGQDVPMDVTIYVGATGGGGSFNIADAGGVIELAAGASWAGDVAGENIKLHFHSYSTVNAFVEHSRQTGL